MKTSKLVYSQWGDPLQVVKLESDTLPSIKHNEVLIKMLAAPLNPADMLTIYGKYPSKPEFPAIPGNEGVGEVLEVGADVVNFKIGDRVVPLTNKLGTWRAHMIVPQDLIFKIPKNLGLVEASTFTVNPCTAYRMLKDFVDLKAGDVVIQNGANSACGQNVIQLCRIWGFKSVNIIRDRTNIQELKQFLKGLGATEVFTEEELKAANLMQKPKLALNCVGGESALELMQHLDHGGTIVTYGGMSGEPLTVPMSALIFQDLKVRGFWMTEWNKRHFECKERDEMLGALIKLMLDKQLRGPPSRMVQLKEYKEALKNTMNGTGMTGLKYILCFDE